MEGTVQKILDFLTKMGEQLSPTAKQVLDIYTKQAYAEGITDAIIAVISLIIFGLCIWGIVWCFKKNEDELTFFLGAIALLMLTIILIFGTSAVKELINPQYYAIRQLIQLIK